MSGMKIEVHRRPPMGVSELMFVSGADPAPAPDLGRWWLVAGGLLAAAWWLGRKR